MTLWRPRVFSSLSLNCLINMPAKSLCVTSKNRSTVLVMGLHLGDACNVQQGEPLPFAF